MRDLIYSFHMPLFFLISGYFLKITDLKSSFKKYARNLLRPYLVTSVFAVFIVIALAQINGVPVCGRGGYFIPVVYEFLQMLFWAPAGHIPGIYFGLIAKGSALWFLFALFWASVGYMMIHKLPALNRAIIIVAILLLSCYITRYTRLPFSLCQGGVALTYIYIGNRIKEANLLEKMVSAKWYYMLCPLAIWLLAVYEGGLTLGKCAFGQYPLLIFAGSLMGSLCFVWLFYRLFNFSFKYGRYTLYIMCGHAVVQYIFLYNGRYYNFNVGIYMQIIVYFIFSFLFAVIIYFLLNKKINIRKCISHDEV